MISPSLYIIIAAMGLAFLVTFLTAIPVIAFLRWKKLGQQIREEGPQRHQGKAGTPTMGGVVILAGTVAGTLLAILIPWYTGAPHIHLRTALLLLALTVAVAGIGAVDDWGKIRRGRSLGLKAREKLILQFVVALLFIGTLLYAQGYQMSFGIPGFGEVPLAGWLFWPLALLFVAGFSNATNLTDGLDGLAAGTSAIACFALAAIAWFSSPDALGHAVAGFNASLGAACTAFLWYNRHPARVFMGDTGSLAIGAALAGTAMVLKQEVLFLLIGLIFCIEAGSVILQVVYFKLTGGKRIFRMSPYHHHLELGGWTEPQIVTRAWLFGLVVAIAGFCVFRCVH
jgi:phospho-N-acetylmuramoyl-pentapeptide-transferase